MSDENQTPDTTTPPPPARRTRKIFLYLLLLIIVLVAAGVAVWYFTSGRWYESTDDAYVNGNVVQITSRIPGTVISIGADNNDLVKQGQTLVKLDASNADVALAQAKAALGQSVRKVSGLYSTARTSKAEVAVREAAVKQASADYDRRRQLASSGAISTEELAHARDALTTAQSALAAVQAQLATAEAQIAGTQIATHPDVEAAAAQLRAAWLDDQRTTVPAPVSGYVAMRSVQVGQHVQPGTPLMAVVPLAHVWVDANFKETQLTDMRIGQPVTLTADIYGDSFTYHGKVVGLGIGTGSAFSLLPAQNATGNWIKIVQRLPVRIALDPKELQDHPLRIGLSMDVTVDLHDTSLPMLAQKATEQPVLSTDVFDNDHGPVDALIATIIRANGGGPAKEAAAATHDRVTAAR
ncbi:MAG: HlyD family efflux transporter periplasmic adaptor subunit [Burkholderiaceae bacterium]|nr:MAG: HlyD family efflux transporter periplasmic adaptor subunit [Burkholderiaceae bacterium]